MATQASCLHMPLPQTLIHHLTLTPAYAQTHAPLTGLKQPVVHPPTEEFALGIEPKSLHATVLMQTVYNAVIQHSGGFLIHVAISVFKKVKIMVV